MKPLARNFMASAGADAGSRILGFLVIAYLARTLGPASFGIISIAMAVLGYALLLAGPGLNVLGTRHVAATEGPELTFSGDVTAVRSLLALLCVAVAGLALLPVYGASVSWLTVVVFTLAAVPAAAGPDWYLQGRGAMGWLAGARLASYAVYLLLVVMLVRGEQDIAGAAVAFTVGSGAGCLLAFVGFVRLAGAGPAIAWRPDRWLQLLRESIPFGVSSILAQTIVNLPVLLVGIVLSNRETGLFGAAMKLIFFALMIDRIFYLLFLPAASRAHAEAPVRLGYVTRIALKAVLLVALPVAGLGIRLATPVLTLVYGAGFTDAAPVLICAIPYFVFTVVNTVMMSVLYAARREREFLRVLSLSTVLLILLCAVLTPLFGAAGSAAGLSLGELVMAVLLVRLTGRQLGDALTKTLLPFLGAAAVMATVLALPRADWLAGGGAVAAFLICVVVLGGITRDDLRVAREKLA